MTDPSEITDEVALEGREERKKEETKERRKERRVEASRKFWAVMIVLGILFGGYVVWTQHTISSQGVTILNLSQRSLISQDNHHASTVRSQQVAAVTEQQIKDAEAVIQYEGGVIAYQNGVIIQAQQQGHATLNVITQLQTDLTTDFNAVSTALINGQKQINTYLQFLATQTCVTQTKEGIACSVPPPLPSTSSVPMMPTTTTTDPGPATQGNG